MPSFVMMTHFRRVYVEALTCLLFLCEFTVNVLRFVGLGRRYFRSEISLVGKVAVVTGANSGIGKETSYQLSKRGARVIMCCRDVQRGLEAARDIQQREPSAQLQVVSLDLASLVSVERLARKLGRLETCIDLLINNAGVMMCPPSKSQEGYELQFAVNHLGHFALTHHLLPLLANSDDGRIINVSSVHHVRGRIFFENLNFEQAGSYDPVEAYCQSKMANVLFTRELSKRMSEFTAFSNLKTYALNPGTINTNLTRHVHGIRKTIFVIIGTLFNLDIYTGSQTTLYCALESSLRHESGYYYSNCQKDECIFRESRDDQIAKKLWDVSCQMIGIEPKQYFKI